MIPITAPAQVAFEGVASVLGLALAFVVWRFGHPPLSRLVGTLLFLDGFSQLGFFLGDALVRDPGISDIFTGLGILAFVLTVTPYLLVIATLDTPFARPLHRRAVPLAIGAFGLAVGLVPVSYVFTHLGAFGGPSNEIPPSIAGSLAVAVAIPAAIYVYALVASVSAVRRAEPGTAKRAKARAYALAFGARDGLYLVAALVNIGLVALLHQEAWASIGYPLWASATLAFVVLLAYGFLKTQLFDIDLRIKRGISRSTVVTLGIVVVFIAAKAAEAYLNRTVGFVAGAIAAGLMLFLTPRLNKLGDKVADTAMPKVDASPAYLQFKKLEVYKAAVETAIETGGIDERERTKLDRLRAKLGLAEGDCAALERELVPVGVKA